MNLEQINYLITVVEYGSIKKAAEVLGLKRTTLLMSLNALEKELDRKLLIRQKEGTTLTADSADLFSVFKKMQIEINSMELLRQHWYSEKSVQIFSTSAVLTSLIEKVNSSYLTSSGTKRQNIQITASSLTESDFIFTCNPQKLEDLCSYYSQYQLFDSPYCICLRNTHPFAQKRFLDLASEEIQYPILVLSDEPLEGYPYQPINNLSSLQRIISTSDCLALVPEIFFKHIASPFNSLMTQLQIQNRDLHFKAFLLVHPEVIQYAGAADYLHHILSSFKE